jgi:Ni2+-binding GTPase involved in maturation of urease and hydrogenase
MLTIILTGPQGCGKTQISELLVSLLGETRTYLLIDGDYRDGDLTTTPDVLIVTGLTDADVKRTRDRAIEDCLVAQTERRANAS